MPLSWNEIRNNALGFSREWKDECSEDAEAKSFWDAFFSVFGITRRRVASFEKPVRKSDGKGGYIDLLWKGILLVEHKSRGKDLDRAYHQATDYFYGLKERDLPRYVLVSDFARFRLFDLDTNQTHEFALEDLHKHVGLFGFIAGYQTHAVSEKEEAVNVEAAQALGKLHDQLSASGYDGHPLEVLLVRLLFCLFADDTGIFERNQFRDYLEQRTGEDGADLGMHLAQLFQILNTPPEKRQKKLDEQLAGFTYVNGRLFEESLSMASFDRTMREALLDCCGLDWSKISPAIFGSLFQSIMDKDARRNLGAHYTRELNILKALKPLFLDGLQAELGQLRGNTKKLLQFQKKLAVTRVFDPACGCGNFLVIAYRELRLIELAVLRELYKAGEASRSLDVKGIVYVDVDQFYGIEIEEFPAQIAQVALWLTDHQMNLQVSKEFGQYFVRLPLVKSPNITHGNALTIAWASIVDPATLSYIVGNPPFVGKSYQSPSQKAEMARVMAGISGAGVLDYVCAWYVKAARYIQGTNVACAFVSTNSISQGEQVGVLWSWLLAQGVKTHFAHRTFQWSNEARHVATVQCVIIGFGLADRTVKWIFDYPDAKGEPHALAATRINPYLLDAPTILIDKRSSPVCTVPPMLYGSKPVDDGNLILDAQAREDLTRAFPQAAALIRPFIGTDELLYGRERWCLWLKNATPAELRLPAIRSRVDAVRRFRADSKKPATRRDAAFPSLFAEDRQSDRPFLAVPEVSGERRKYFPIGFLPPTTIASNKLYTVPDATLYDFGVLSSTMHFAWMAHTSGRLESRFQYSASLTYNNFPWPEATGKQKQAIETAAQSVLDVRAAFPASSLADLYDPLSMPPDLVKAHQALDRTVDAAYGKTTFKSEAERVAFLFALYGKITSPLMPKEEKKKARRVSGTTRTSA